MLTTNFKVLGKSQIGQKLEVGGFVHTIRDHGGLIFIDLRSETDLLQCVIDPTRNPEVFKLTENIHSEYVLKITGNLVSRTPETINPNLPTGEIELEIESLEIVSKAKTLPFDIHAEDKNLAGEETRLKYRFLDFRREKLKKLMWLRHKFILKTRNWFDKEGFIEVQTPILANSSPEGARDYLVPSRIHPGKFFALPQAPQQFKQLLMVGGFNKYFQIAPCFRDEDPRADRAVGDFYQIDLEMAWASQEDIFKMFERFVWDNFTDPTLTDKKLVDKEFPRLTYDQAMNMYGSDKPDLRYDLAWVDSKPLFKDSGFKVFADLAEDKNSRVQALVLKGQVNKFSRSDLDRIQDIGRSFGLPGIAYIQYFEDGAKSPIFKFLGEEKTAELAKFFDTQTGDLVLFLANPNKDIVFKAQNMIRKHIAEKLNLIDENILKFAWISDFPFYEQDDKTGKIDFCHNPFGVWKSKPGKTSLETLNEAIASNTVLDLRAIQYDITCNGYEISSGGVRNNNPESILKGFEVVGYTEEEVRAKFGHMLEAYEFGAPYHAGFAPGVDRILMILTGETNIREVIPFPKNGSGIDPMTNAPSVVSPRQLKDLGIEVSE
ncbi:MAG: aspartate--tRNA ligase [bacterium]